MNCTLRCRGCKYCISELYCELTKLVIMNPDEIIKCEYWNKDLSHEKICLNCKYLIGGGDWGLSCAKDYYKLSKALDTACDNFEKGKFHV